MLRSLSIRDIVLIERLELDFQPGFSALTGETGAGKSIILDALGLALGARGERGLVRGGAEQGSVAAEFDLAPDHPLWDLLSRNGIEGGELIVRRTLGTDGRSRAFINDTAVSGTLLREAGELLVEVHGQFAQRGLMDARAHRALLDAFGGLEVQAALVRSSFQAWRAAGTRFQELQAEVEAARREEDYLRHRERELAELEVRAGEEEELAASRQGLMHREKLVSLLEEALASLAGSGGAIERVGSAERRLERNLGLQEEALGPAVQALGRSLAELAEAEAALEAALRQLAEGGQSLAEIEDRLFSLRDAARKHRLPVDELPHLLDETRLLLSRIDAGASGVEEAQKAVTAARATYRDAAQTLSKGRQAAAVALARAVLEELPPLRLEKARFRVALEPLPEDEAGPDGLERVAFEVATNVGQGYGAMSRIASGGELSRFMLALKVVLARLDSAGTLIFDEVDAGLGGATAAAVGERLARLGHERQVLVVTHAPQVAARAAHHFTVAKAVARGHTLVEVRELKAGARRDEIARMLAGERVTDAALLAAESLIRSGADAA